MTIKQHYPGFCEFDPKTAQFENLDELFQISWVKKFMDDPSFHRFSKSDNHLMAEYKGGKEWWVVGYFEDEYDLDLPKLKYK